MPDWTDPAPPAIRRQLGRSRSYATSDLPARLRHWHAPRANRWERLCVDDGTLDVQWLGPDGITSTCLHAGEGRWIAPGTRWRVVHMDGQARFQLEIHADDATPICSPQATRTAWLDEVESEQLDDGAAFTRLLTALALGQRRLVRGRFDVRAALHAVAEQRTLFWHPLAIGDGKFTAFIARAGQSIGLPEYMGRDHAVIEATLAGALRGSTEHAGWLRASLARHLAIEEELLFPTYLRAHGNVGWVRGLRNEHEHLRQGLDALDALAEPAARRRFLLLLDGHDEKEEQIVYPDMLVRLAVDADALTRAAILHPLPGVPD